MSLVRPARLNIKRLTLGTALLAVPCGLACGSGDDGPAGGSGGTSAGGNLATGGAPAGGVSSGGSSSGGASAGLGGTLASTGGVSSGGSASIGGAANSGGSTSGGSTSGGDSGAGGTVSGGTGGSGAGGAPAVTCPSPALSPGDSNKTIMVGGKSRSYVLHVPAAYNGSKAVPFIIDFHGLGGSGPSQRSSSPYPAQTDADGVIMAFPTGASGPSGAAWNVGPCCVADVDDVAFAKAMVEEVKGLACVDEKRVYAVGFSMGGGMSHYLACHAADVFAAVAPAAFDLLDENVGTCQPSRPLTIVHFRGTSDPIVPYAGGYSSVVSGMPITFMGAEATFAKWAQINECTGTPSTKDSNGCSTYSECAADTTVTLCSKQGGGHDAGNAQVAWPILKQHTLP